MRCLTKEECSEWLRQHNILESPYRNKETTDAYFQFKSPKASNEQMYLMRRLIGHRPKEDNGQEIGSILGEFEGALLVFLDWSCYSTDEMTLMTTLRSAHGEKRWLINAPGHLFSKDEDADLIGQSYLTLMFGWTAYLYLASKKLLCFFGKGNW